MVGNRAESGIEVIKDGVGIGEELQFEIEVGMVLVTTEADTPIPVPLPAAGLYRNNLLQQFLEAWYNQKFLGTHCTFGDDRHLTNRMLSMGYATK